MDIYQTLKELSQSTGLSGFERKVGDLISGKLYKYCQEVKIDKLGNIIGIKKGEHQNPPKIMIAAHMDEIGLMVTKIEDGGFLRFSSIGGVDERTLLSQAVIIHGIKDVVGIIGAKPPHILEEEEKGKSIPVKDLFIDCGMEENEVRNIINIGNPISIKRDLIKLERNRVSGKSLDNRAGIATMLYTLEELSKYKHIVDVFAVATVQEEVGLRGAITSSYGIEPDISIAIDVCHGDMVGTSEDETSIIGKGPTIALGPNIHSKIYDKIINIAENYKIPYQIEPVPGSTYTDAWAIQITKQGIPTGLISIPLRYMHTSVETLDIDDIKFAGQLLARFISEIDSHWLEGLICY